jgi:hypothetical protein
MRVELFTPVFVATAPPFVGTHLAV